MAGPDVSLETPQPLTNGVHEVREVEVETVQKDGVHEAREVENEAVQKNDASDKAIQTNGIHTEPSPDKAIQTNGIHTEPSPETIRTNGFHTSTHLSDPEQISIHTSSITQKNGTHSESIQTNGVHSPFYVDADFTAILHEAPVVDGIHPLKAAKIEAAAAHATSNSVKLEPEHVATTNGITKTRSDSGVSMTNGTIAQ